MPSRTPEQRLFEELWALPRKMDTARGVTDALHELKSVGKRYGKSWSYGRFVNANHQALNGLVWLQRAIKHTYSERRATQALESLRQARVAFEAVATDNMPGRELMTERELADRLHIITWQIAVAHTLLRKHGVSMPGSSIIMDIQSLSLDEQAEVMVAIEAGELLRNRLA